MVKLELLTDEELIEDLKTILSKAEEAANEKDYEKAVKVKDEVREKDDYLDKEKFRNVGTQTFQTYCWALKQARANTGGHWSKNPNSPDNNYLSRLYSIKTDLNHELNFL